MDKNKRRRGGPLGPHADRRTTPTGLAKRIIDLRLELGLSQERLAERLGIARSTLAQWEAGMTSPRGLYLKAVEDWLRKKGGKKRG